MMALLTDLSVEASDDRSAGPAGSCLEAAWDRAALELPPAAAAAEAPPADLSAAAEVEAWPLAMAVHPPAAAADEGCDRAARVK